MRKDSLEQAYQRLAAATSDISREMIVAELILSVFDEFYRDLCGYPYLAKRAFETMDAHASVRISRERLNLYSRYIAEHGPRLRSLYDVLAFDESKWDEIDRLFAAMIIDRYEADIAFSFAHSMRRNISNASLWRPVSYSFPPPSPLRALSMASVYRRIAVNGRIEADTFRYIFDAPAFEVPFQDLERDLSRIQARAEGIFAEHADAAVPNALDVVEAGFFRDRHAFVVARWQYPNAGVVPFVVAFLNSPTGIYVDAVLHRVADIHTLFSSTLANLHVTTKLYYQTCLFLYSLMPRRPLGEHYSTIGYNHVGKVAILDEINSQIDAGAAFKASPGAAGTVALGFTFPECAYHLKVIRDHPTRDYKWGAFPGVVAVEDKYREVHEINRAGSMLDNVMYFNLRMEKRMFDPALLADICVHSSGSVRLAGESVYLRSLIVQLKIVPLPLYLENASDAEIHAAMIGLGACIRNNAATNIFNKDLDSRNYGVGRYGRVFLFDYDAVEKLTDVKIRTNTDREPGEDDVPSWFFESGVIFLPEELESGMQFGNDFARRCFRNENSDLLGMGYWLEVQQKLQRGEVPPLRMYPEDCRLS